MVKRTTLGAIALMAELAAWPAIAGVPPTERQPVRETVNGVELVDPYRWLEGSAAPEVGSPDGALDARVAEWTDAQNAHTRSVLDRLPGRESLETRLRELLGAGTVGAPELRGDRGFFLKRQGEQAQPVLYVRDLAGGPARPLVDPNALDPEGLTSLGWYEPSPSGDLVAFGLFRAGDENTTLYLADVATGAWLADEIPGKSREPSWLPDGSGFVYRRLADADDPYSGEVRFHRVGHHRRQDPLLYEQAEEGPLATTWGPYAELSADGDWLVLIYWTGTGSNDLYVADFRRFRAGEGLEWKPVVVGEDALTIGVAEGGTLYLRTTLGADNGRVMAVDLAELSPETGRGAWREVIPERPDAALTDLSLARGHLVAGYVQGAVSRFEVFTRAGESRGPLALPGPGTAGIATDSGRAGALVSFESFNQPATLYLADLAAGTLTPWEEAEVPVDPDAFEVRRVAYRSADGTEVPMFLVHKKGLERNGGNPAVLTGYGGFNISITPEFESAWVPWLERGGVYAVANLRGGGELGEEWHRAGMLEKKQNVFDDFLAAAEWLVAEGYTRPERLGILGGSNGGLLTGAALTQRPDLFGAVISAVPLLDMLRYQHFLMAKYWVPEYGSAEDPEQFRYLLDYSPYHNVRDGVRYPAVLLLAGENDTRVHPLHARKMAARLQAATASAPAEAPVLLWIDRSAGHGAGKPLVDRIREAADSGLFMMWQLGLLGESGEAPGSISGAANAGAPAGGSSSLREAASPRR
jgi:prolyl oligopeptidase